MRLRLFFLIAGVGLFVYLLIQLGPVAVLGMLARIGWHGLGLAGLYFLYQAVRALALMASIAEPPGITWRDAMWIRFSGEAIQFLTFTGPFLAEPAKAWLLKGRGLTAVAGFAATIVEYLVYTFVAAAMSIVALWWLLANDVLVGGPRTTAIVLVVVMGSFLAVSAFAIVRRMHLLGAILERISKVPGIRRRLRPDMPAVHRTEDLLLAILRDRPGRLAWITLLESAGHFLLLVELYWILRALELGTGLGTAFVLEGAVKFIGLAFFFVPAQVGASEGTYTVLFGLVGLPALAGFTVPFVRRMRMMLVAAVGLLAMSLLGRETRN